MIWQCGKMCRFFKSPTTLKSNTFILNLEDLAWEQYEPLHFISGDPKKQPLLFCASFHPKKSSLTFELALLVYPPCSTFQACPYSKLPLERFQVVKDLSTQLRCDLLQFTRAWVALCKHWCTLSVRWGKWVVGRFSLWNSFCFELIILPWLKTENRQGTKQPRPL